MAVVQNTYTGNGSTVLYSLSFPYLDQTDVKVSVNGTIVTNYIFATASSIQFLMAPANGAAIRIYRETDIDEASNTIFAGSAIKASDLNENFTQTLYAVQESNFEADSATTTANTALTTANTALGTANTALSNSSTAVSTANSAVSTANAANASAAAAVSTANTASSNASAAVTTANAASSAASTAVSTANAATSTANTALSNSTTAISTANTASTNASNAVTTANTASSNATTAVATANAATTTANNALSTANTALSNSNTAISTANSAIAAVASAVIYTPVANLTALAALTPTNGDYFELTDSTGAESSALITGVTVGLVGAPGLTFRLRYDAPPGIFTFLGYFANDSETRYLKLAGGTLTGQLRGDDSTSASTPGFAFDGDPNTGLGRPGADELALITGGTARVTIDSAGAVAVPGSLSQGGNAVVVTTDSRLSDQRVPTDGSVTNTKVAAAAAIDGTKISPNFGSQNVVTTGTSSAAALIPTGSSVPTNGTYLPAANAVAIATNSTERLRIDSSGRLGLGSSSPGTNFELRGSGASIAGVNAHALISDSTTAASGVGGSILFEGNYTSGGARAVFSGIAGTKENGTDSNYAGNLKFYTRANGSLPALAMTIDSSQRVGIGTTTPAFGAIDHGVHIYGSGAQEGIRLESTNGSGGIFEIYAENGGNTLDTRGSGYIRFNNAATEWGRWDSSGRFLVGTSTAYGTAYTTPVQVKASGSLAGGISIVSSNNENAGGLILASSSDNSVRIDSDPDNLRGNSYIGFNVDATERMRIDRNGVIDKVVGVYNNTTAVAANLYIGAGGDFNRSTSSGKYKTQVEDIEYQYSDVLLNCRPVWYRSTCKGDNPDHGWWGFIAEEVAEIDPRLVQWKTVEITYDENGAAVENACEPQAEGVAYDRFVPHLLNLIKRQKEQIEAMEARLAALEAS